MFLNRTSRSMTVISINTKIRIIGCRIDGILVDDKPVDIAHKGETATLLISPKTSKSVRKSDESVCFHGPADA